MDPDYSEAKLNALVREDLPRYLTEVKVYRALKQLPDDYTVFYSVPRLSYPKGRQTEKRETDFIVCHPAHGYLCIEVKGGGIERRGDHWYRENSEERIHPVEQASRSVFEIRKHLKTDKCLKKLRDLGLPFEFQRQVFKKGQYVQQEVLYGYAVLFPGVDDDRVTELTGIDLPAALIGSKGVLENPQACQAWIDGCFANWRGKANNSSIPIGDKGIAALKTVLRPSGKAQQGIDTRIQDQEAYVLSEEQKEVLVYPLSQRVAVCGGAGTGKTVLAIRKACELAGKGFKTLLTCANNQLALDMERECTRKCTGSGIENLEVIHFQMLCKQQGRKAEEASGRDLYEEAKEKYGPLAHIEVLDAYALAESLKILPDDRYDAIVCDEAQDFREEYWEPLVGILKDPKDSPLCVFYDSNQNLYQRPATFPIPEGNTLPLSKNYRNTRPIHEKAYKYYKNQKVHVTPREPINVEDEVLFYARERDAQAQAIFNLITKLISDRKISAGNITVLIADSDSDQKTICYEALNKALKESKTSESASWSFWVSWMQGSRPDSSVLVETVRRFKGRESPIVILWGLDTIDLADHKETLYVGMSRAKSILIVVGTPDTCKAIQEYQGRTGH